MTRGPKVAAGGRNRGAPTLIADLASGRPASELAKETGLSERTIRRRRNAPEVPAARAAIVEQVIDQLPEPSSEMAGTDSNGERSGGAC
jgi:hypothetical protein